MHFSSLASSFCTLSTRSIVSPRRLSCIQQLLSLGWSPPKLLVIRHVCFPIGTVRRLSSTYLKGEAWAWGAVGCWLGEEINNATFPREKTCDFSTLQFLRLNKISWLVMKITDLRDTDKSRNFAITELNNFNNCFIIGSESFFSYLPHEPQTTLTMLWWNYSLSRREHFFQLLSDPESGLNPWTWLANLILTPVTDPSEIFQLW